MNKSEYPGMQLAREYLDRIKSVRKMPPPARGLQVEESKILSLLGLTDEELDRKIKTRSGNRSLKDEKLRVIRTIIGVLHQVGGGILKNTKDKYLVPEEILNAPELFRERYQENYRQFYDGEEPII